MSARPFELEPGLLTPVPRQLGKYVVSQVLGEGAMGIVYKAIDPHINRPVAIKAIRAPLLAPGAHDLAAATRFRTEAQAAGRLSHPNIVSVYEYGDTGHECYIAMEYVEGTSLLELTGHGERLPLDDALSVMMQLLDALACAHAQGVWHRDIKPANLLITPEGRLKVTDFGIARIDSADRTHHTTVLGSPGYMAPERYTDEAPDQRVDIFSCGVLLFELLTGQPPFRGSSSAVMYQVLNQSPPEASSLKLQPPVPRHFDSVIAQALAKRAADRFADAAQMRQALCVAADRPIRPAVSIDTLVRLRTSASTQVMPRSPVCDASRPGASVPSVRGWDAQALKRIEAQLLPQLGPLARLVVRDAARRCHDLPALVAHIAAEAFDPEERQAFIAQAHAICPESRAATKPTPSGPLPVLGTTPMRPDLIEKARHVLASHIGPLAGLLARRAAVNAASREQFFTALADQAGEEIDRKQLLADLWRIA